MMSHLCRYYHYEFENNLSDSTGNGNTGTINSGGSETYVPGPDGKTFDFDGISHIETNSASFDFAKTDEFTISTWLKTSETGVPDVLLGKLNHNVGYQIYLNSNNEVKVTIASGSSNKILVETVGANVRDNDWHHVALTYDGTELASGVKIYLDGIESSLNVIKDQGFGSDDIQNTEKLTIGNQRRFYTTMHHHLELKQQMALVIGNLQMWH